MKTENSLKWQLLLLINLAASSCNVGAALLSQLNWDLWRYVGNKEFNDYHYGWWHGIWWAAFPVAGVALIGTCMQLKWKPPYVGLIAVWIALILQLLIYTGTALWWGPSQSRLQFIHEPDGSLNPSYLLLVNSNWVRTVLFIFSFLLQFWISLKVFLSKSVH